MRGRIVLTGAPFASGDTILTDNLPTSSITYGAPAVSGTSGVGGSGSVACALSLGDLSCTASGGSVTLPAGASFEVLVKATPSAAGTFTSPRQAGSCSVDPNGVITEVRHELFGVCFAGKVLVFPSAKGSSGWSGFFQTTRLSGTAPAGMVIGRISAKSALGAVVTRVPAVTDLDADPCAVIATGDWVLINNSTVEVTKR